MCHNVSLMKWHGNGNVQAQSIVVFFLLQSEEGSFFADVHEMTRAIKVTKVPEVQQSMEELNNVKREANDACLA